MTRLFHLLTGRLRRILDLPFSIRFSSLRVGHFALFLVSRLCSLGTGRGVHVAGDAEREEGDDEEHEEGDEEALEFVGLLFGGTVSDENGVGSIDKRHDHAIVALGLGVEVLRTRLGDSECLNGIDLSLSDREDLLEHVVLDFDSAGGRGERAGV